MLDAENDDLEARFAKEREEGDRRYFERRKAERDRDIALEDRIKRLSRDEAAKVVFNWVQIGAAILAYREWEWAGAILAFAACQALTWYANRQEAKSPRFDRRELDDQAEDCVTLERILAKSRNGEPWLTLKRKEWEATIFEDGYWRDVNKCVDEFEYVNAKQRKDRLAELRKQTLPTRLAMEAQFKERGFDLPYWARVLVGEKSA